MLHEEKVLERYRYARDFRPVKSGRKGELIGWTFAQSFGPVVAPIPANQYGYVTLAGEVSSVLCDLRLRAAKNLKAYVASLPKGLLNEEADGTYSQEGGSE